jgi:probable HAF family extracellular repeat protein
MSWRPLGIIAAVVGGALLLGSVTASAQAGTNLIDLGAVAPGLGINNSGQVVLRNYWYSKGTLTAFPNGFQGNAINASGHIAGGYGIYYYGTVTALPTPGNGAYYDFQDPNPVAINDSGAVTIEYSVDEVANASVLYSNGTLSANIDIPGIVGCGTDFTAYAMNDSDQILGNCGELQGGVFIYDATKNDAEDVGVSGSGFAINASGEATGTISSPSAPAAFIYSHGKVTVLPDGAGAGYAINASGFVVGDGVNGKNHAFFYNGTTTIDLNTLVLSTDPLKPYVTLTDARGINDNGLIIVNGTDSRDNSGHAYLFQVSSESSAGTSSGGSSKGGGGAFDSLSLSLLIGMLALHRIGRQNRLPQ